MTRARRLSVLFAATFVALTLIGRADQSRDEIALRAAMETETIKGDLKSAVAQFQKLSTSADRTVAATALLHLAGCYGKLGQADARRVYEDIIERFKDQPDVVAEANRKLATSNTGASAFSLQLMASKKDDRRYGNSVSRDGRYIPFANHDRLNVLDLTTGEDRVVFRTPNGDPPSVQPLISPDGRSVAYYSDRTSNRPQGIRVVNVDGSQHRDLLVGPQIRNIGPAALDWSPDGSTIVVTWLSYGPSSAPEANELRLVSATDGSTRASFKVGNFDGVSFKPGQFFTPRFGPTRFSPDGRYLAVSVQGVSLEGAPTSGIWILKLSDRSVTRVLDQNAFNPFWTPDGNSLVFQRIRLGLEGLQGLDLSGLWSIAISGGKPAGEPRFLMRDVPSILGASRDGGLFYRKPNSTRDIYAVDIDPATGQKTLKPIQLTSNSDNRRPAWSPDGTRLAYITIRDTRTQVVVETRRGSSMSSRVYAPAEPGAGLPDTDPRFVGPLWTPDGNSLLVYGPNPGLIRLDVDSGKFSPVFPGTKISIDATAFNTAARLSRDGRFLYYFATGPSSEPRRIAKLDLESGAMTDVARVTGVRLNGLSVSPDGQQLAFTVQTGTGRRDLSSWVLMVVPASGGEPREIRRVSDIPIRETVWSADGKRLFFTSAVNRWDGDYPIEVGADIWTVALDGSNARRLGIGLSDEYHLDIHPNGRQLIWMEENYRNELWMLRLPAASAAR
jgi:Tol biopolymer transport system component